MDGIKESIKMAEKHKPLFNERVNTVEKNAEGITASVKKITGNTNSARENINSGCYNIRTTL